MVLFGTGSVSAWTEGGYLFILSDAKYLMPQNLQWVLDNFQPSLLSGMKYSVEENLDDALLVKAVLAESQKGIEAFKTQGSFKDGVRSLGRIARLVANLNNPLNHAPALKQPSWRTDYDIFLEKNRGNFRIRWPGVDGRPRSESELTDALNQCSLRTKKVSRILIKTFESERKPIGTYDVRSIPFGVGSIAYSRSVANTALSWLFIWDQAGGIKTGKKTETKASVKQGKVNNSSTM
jgi:hypothetical protein